MFTKRDRNEVRVIRHARVRKKISGTPDRPRLCVYRSNMHIYAQIIDDVAGNTLVAASTVEKEIASQLQELDKTGAAKLVGKIVAEQADESVLTDGKVDYDKLQPIIFDIATMTYRVVGPVVGKAFHDGMKLKG